MSSKKFKPGDLWSTPGWCSHALIDRVDLPRFIIEPSAGVGGIVGEMMRSGRVVLAVEVEGDRCRELEALGCTVVHGDWLDVSLGAGLADFASGGRVAIVGNPPWSPARVMTDHVVACLHLLEMRTVDVVALLLPVSWFHGGSGRAEVWRKYGPPSQVICFERRPKFVAGGGVANSAWLIWRDRIDAGLPVLSMVYRERSDAV